MGDTNGRRNRIISTHQHPSAPNDHGHGVESMPHGAGWELRKERFQTNAEVVAVTATAQPQHSHSTVTAQSQHSHSTTVRTGDIDDGLRGAGKLEMPGLEASLGQIRA